MTYEVLSHSFLNYAKHTAQQSALLDKDQRVAGRVPAALLVRVAVRETYERGKLHGPWRAYRRNGRPLVEGSSALDWVRRLGDIPLILEFRNSTRDDLDVSLALVRSALARECEEA